MPVVRARYLVLVARFFPVWLSYLLITGLLFAVWINPMLLGWDSARDLRAFVILEITVVVLLTALITGIDEPIAFLSSILTLAFAATVLVWADASSVVAAVILCLHLLAYIATLRSNPAAVSTALPKLELTLLFAFLAWLAIGFLPLPHLGWRPESTPSDLWWQVGSWNRNLRVPHALPSWGFFYFGASAFAAILRSNFFKPEQTAS
jgi:hypothetical protein